MSVVKAWVPLLLLVLSNVAMTLAWYRHLHAQAQAPLWVAILTSWGIAFFEYCLMVPANRMGYGQYTLPQLKVIQEVITLLVFAVFAVGVMKVRLTLNHLWGACCLVGAVYFFFRR